LDFTLGSCYLQCPPMEKSTFTREYKVLCSQLRAVRADAGVTQAEIAKRLRETQSEISKFERGDRRLDLVQLRKWCRALGISLSDFVARFETALSRKG
jgi:transcriptional regulator with XRE-family HTH domain